MKVGASHLRSAWGIFGGCLYYSINGAIPPLSAALRPVNDAEQAGYADGGFVIGALLTWMIAGLFINVKQPSSANVES
jgi:hypothetical protein